MPYIKELILLTLDDYTKGMIPFSHEQKQKLWDNFEKYELSKTKDLKPNELIDFLEIYLTPICHKQAKLWINSKGTSHV